MKNVFKTLGLVGLLAFASCNSDQTLQEYFVNHQDDNDFIAVDVPTSLLDKDEIELSADEKETLESIKKVNFLALKLNDDLRGKFDKETAAIGKILSSDKYETLMKFGSNGTKVELKFQGDEDKIDEVIVFANDQEKGLALIRVLGDNMKPANIAKLAKSMEKMDLSAFKQIAETIDID
ncbi:DUF4252 domain-containing protein [Aquimarina sp. AD10]|uniref:DUF4252 domain-containing protein n=1 Tax=Aquimarina aggregata TaxID=1642818 RepID=A0A163BM94_9FLAO|nr:MULTISPECIES: DUF4252 domain-containing protein [Aquimarina]AXT59026.1 DUF4252 domain-containing protein [Aquimarina sp. AD10]KZS41541.1 hypothetical protein AWE51_21275 [Aquimarina aggregata]RKM95121.1 DUF4252 domain-containing protein [Aquimarina sp. AD10]